MNCNRCCIRQASIKCNNCEENNLLCNQCSDFVHSVSLSQQSHKLEFYNNKNSSNSNFQNNLEISFKDKLGFKFRNDFTSKVVDTDSDNHINHYQTKINRNNGKNDSFKEYKQYNDTNENFTPSLNTKNNYNVEEEQYKINEQGNILSHDNSLIFKQTNYSNNLFSKRNQSCLSNPITDRVDETSNLNNKFSNYNSDYNECLNNLDRNDIYNIITTKDTKPTQLTNNEYQYSYQKFENDNKFNFKSNKNINPPYANENCQSTTHNYSKDSNNPIPRYTYNSNEYLNQINEKEMFERFKSSNYVLNIRKMYEADIEELRNKNSNYNQMLVDMKDSYESKLDSLERLIYSKNENYNTEISNLEKLYEEKLSKLLGEKDLKIKYLSEITDDLTNKNTNLLSQLEVLSHKYKSFKIYSAEKEKSLEHKIQKKELEIEELKKYIEIKISHLENKNKEDYLIQNKTNEKVIDNLVSEYNENKKKYIKIIEEKETEIKELFSSGKKSDEHYTKIIAELRESELELKNKVTSLVVKFDEKRLENEYLNSKTEKLEKNLEELNKEIKEIKNSNRELEESNIDLTARLEKVQGLKYGKFNIKIK